MIARSESKKKTEMQGGKDKKKLKLTQRPFNLIRKEERRHELLISRMIGRHH